MIGQGHHYNSVHAVEKISQNVHQIYFHHFAPFYSLKQCDEKL